MKVTGHRCTYKAVFHPKCFYDSISAPELSFVKKEAQHDKGERFSLLPAHTTPLHCCFLKHQQGRNQHHTSTKLFLHTPTFLCSALPIQLISSQRTQLEGCRMKGSQQQCILSRANLGRFTQPLLQSSQGTGRTWDPAAAAELSTCHSLQEGTYAHKGTW